MTGEVIRTCLACGRKRAKKSLLRLAGDSEVGLVIDHDQRLAGRGAYCCNNTTCLRKLCRSRKKVIRALRRDNLPWSEELKAFSGVNDE